MHPSESSEPGPEAPSDARLAEVGPPRPPEEPRLSREDLAQGRIALRLLEHGKGPTIEIAWPQEERERARLYELLTRCHGMRVALLDGAGRMYAEHGARGQAWEINLDRYSGFLRRPSGRVSAGERARLDAIRRRHELTSGVRHVRVFPRRVDAGLLVTLARLAGEDLSVVTGLRGRYAILGGRAAVTDLAVDGRRLSGSAGLPTTASRCL